MNCQHIKRIKTQILERKKLIIIKIRILKHNAKSWDLKLMAAVLGAVGTIWLGYTSFQEHLSITERQYESSINSDMIHIIQDLEKANSDQQRLTNALLLSAYEKDAIAVLLLYLKYERFGKPVRSALELILLKKKIIKDLPVIFYPLLEQTKKVFREAAPKGDLGGKFPILLNHTEAVTDLIDLGLKNDLFHAEFRRDLISRIIEIKNVMPLGKGFPDRATLLKKLQKVINDLGQSNEER